MKKYLLILVLVFPIFANAAPSVTNWPASSLNIGTTIPLQLNGFGTGYARIQTSTSSDDVEQWDIANRSSGTKATACMFYDNDKTGGLGGPGVLTTNYGGVCFAGSNYNIPGFNALKPNGMALFATDGPLTIGSGSTDSASSSVYIQAGSGLDASYDAVFQGGTGNFGVGTSSPGTRLGIQGNSVIAGSENASWFTGTSTLVASSFTYASTTAISSSGFSYFATGSSGANVGISTTTPGAKLSVTNAGSQNTVWISDQSDPDPTPAFVIDAGGNSFFGTSTMASGFGTGRVNINDNSGNMLSMATYAAGNTTMIGMSNSTLDALSLKYLTSIATNIPANVWQWRIGGAASHSLIFSGFDTTPILTLVPSGGLAAFGTTSATTAKLTIEDTCTNTSMPTLDACTLAVINAASSTVNNIESLTFRTNNSNSALYSSGKISIANVDHTAGAEVGDMAFLTRNVGTLAERMRITGAGNVGIGSTTPFATLAVNPTASLASNQFVVGSSTATTLRLDNSGHLFLPSLTSVTGGSNRPACYVAATGELVDDTTTVCQVSSEKYKHNIKPLTVSGLDLVNSIKTVTYVPNDDAPYDYENTQYGFTAEQVASVDPHLAEYGKDGKPRTLDDRALLSIAFKGIQELSRRAGAVRSVEENWQWFVIALLVLVIIKQGRDIKKLK